MIRQFIYKFGSNNQNNMRWFLIGLGLFAVAGGFIALGYYQHHGFQIVGLVIAVPALGCVVYGYLAMLANRLAQILNRLTKNAKRSKY